jgi:hypothetical protein
MDNKYGIQQALKDLLSNPWTPAIARKLKPKPKSEG